MVLVHGIKEHIITIDGLKFKYSKIGQGDHVVLCLPSGMGTVMTDFELQMQHFNLDKLTLLGWELLGRGTNDFIQPMDNDFRELDADYACKFLDKLGVQEYSILGFCHGGNVGIIMAARHKKRVKKLVVFAVEAYVSKREYDIAVNIVSDTSKWGVNLRRGFQEAYGHDRMVRLSAAIAAGVILDYKNGGNTSVKYLPDVTADTMVLVGDRDCLVPEGHVDFIINNLVTTKRQVIIPGGKHYIQRHKFHEFNEAVEGFLLSA